MDKLIKLYLRWLIKEIDEDFMSERYMKLIEHLFNYEYFWIDDLDENLNEHGLNLREKFFDSSIAGRRMRDDYGDIDVPCSVLEMLISLAINAENTVMSNDYYGDRTGVWFWTMLERLELLRYDDRRFDEDAVDEIVDRLLNKKENLDGTFGPFALENTSKFFVKNMSFWKQTMIYMSSVAEENGEI